MRGTDSTYVVCLENPGHAASLEARKIYRRIPDRQAEADEMVRIVDESGEDYLYPTRLFAAISIPESVEKGFAGTE
jgi:hypothetical protein